MSKLIILVFVCIYVAALLGEGEGVTCYHCYDTYNTTLSFRGSDDKLFGSYFTRCDKNKNKWNSWDCPSKWPVCVVMTGKVENHFEILRSCGEENFCAKYKPPAGVTVTGCRECNATLCNDHVDSPSPPVNPDALFTFNININLNIYKDSKISNDGLK